MATLRVAASRLSEFTAGGNFRRPGLVILVWAILYVPASQSKNRGRYEIGVEVRIQARTVYSASTWLSHHWALWGEGRPTQL